MKTYVITLSRYFLAKHSKAGEPTNFKEKFLKGEKVHTIRANYSLWEKRIGEVEDGKAVLSIRQWSGRPRWSKQIEIARLTAKDGVGIQKARIMPEADFLVAIDENYDKYLCTPEEIQKLANNDGLTKEDWEEWFKDCNASKPLAIIHFTKFRY